MEDFKLNEISVDNEIDKLLGLAAAACHTTCNLDRGDIIDWIDHEAEASSTPINFKPGDISIK
ncbi:hypothetical protein DF182_22490 [Chitinophaga flava]|uniref:Uncharacterized protein n=1 Tax=Chitinophaga flava TaxID=2259036 RepID=A0A365XSI5_9BACT|nr:hypothetical protein DF182_22490 [Chitinophaga flava]